MLIQWLMKMCKMGNKLSPTTLKMKVYKITKSRWTPFQIEIFGTKRL